MKIIFEEALSIVFSELVCRYRDDPELVTRTYEVLTKAFYDKTTGALVIDHACLFAREWSPVDRRLVELAPTREDALRHVIGLADAWRAEVQASVPAEPEEISIDD